MNEPFLIAHVVRGEPAFDIAIRCDDMGTESDPGPWWIVPTSGHRAYPYWEDLLEPDWLGRASDMPPDLPDHYACNDRGYTYHESLLTRLGLTKPRPQPPIIRRI